MHGQGIFGLFPGPRATCVHNHSFEMKRGKGKSTLALLQRRSSLCINEPKTNMFLGYFDASELDNCLSSKSKSPDVHLSHWNFVDEQLNCSAMDTCPTTNISLAQLKMERQSSASII